MKIVERLKPHWAWLASAVLVGGALAVVHLTGPDTEVEARAGQVLGYAYPDTGKADGAALRFPHATVSIQVSKPIDHLERADHLEDVVAPDGGSFLALRVTTNESAPYAIDGAEVPSSVEPRLVVVADGRRYPLDTDGATGYLAVAGRPDDVRLEATLDGLTQTVRPSTGERDAGKAARLYVADAEKAIDSACSSRRLTAGYSFQERSDGPSCELRDQVRTAYVEGLGWAAPGHLWLLVTMEVDRNLQVQRAVAGRPVQRYVSVYRDDTLTVRIDGQTSGGSPRFNVGDSARFAGRALAVAQVEQDKTSVRVQITATFHRMKNESDDFDPRAPRDPDVGVSWTETLR